LIALLELIGALLDGGLDEELVLLDGKLLDA
jgi:hypothetical protein